MWARHGNEVALPGTVRVQWIRLAAGMLVMLLAAAPGCGGGGGGDEGDGDQIDETGLRRQFIQTVGNTFILPTYTVLEQETDRLQGSVGHFCSNRTIATLTAAQKQWRLVTGLWMESELVNVRFGPGHSLGEFVRVSWARGEHADTDDIEARIADARPPAANERGLEGLEYLLFGDSEESAAVLDTFVGPMGQARCDYLVETASSLHADTDVILMGWESGGGDYIGLWNSAGAPANSTYRSVKSAIDALMSRVEFVIDDLVNRKLQRVNWKDGEPDMWRSVNTIANSQHHFAAAEMIYLGIDRREDGGGPGGLLAATGRVGRFRYGRLPAGNGRFGA